MEKHKGENQEYYEQKELEKTGKEKAMEMITNLSQKI